MLLNGYSSIIANASSIIVSGLKNTDIVTVYKDKKTYSAVWDSTKQSFIILYLPLGVFTVKATRGSETITETVIIPTTGVYEIKMSFKLWLYNEDFSTESERKCQSVTGGYSSKAIGFNSTYNVPSAPSISYSNNKLIASRTSSPKSYECGIVMPNNSINFTDFTKFNVTWGFNSTGAGSFTNFYFRKSLGNYSTDGTHMCEINYDTQTDSVTNSYNITNFNGSYVLYFDLYRVGTVTIKKIWLE